MEQREQPEAAVKAQAVLVGEDVDEQPPRDPQARAPPRATPLDDVTALGDVARRRSPAWSSRAREENGQRQTGTQHVGSYDRRASARCRATRILSLVGRSIRQALTWSDGRPMTSPPSTRMVGEG